MRNVSTVQVWGDFYPYTIRGYFHLTRGQVLAGYRVRWHDRWPKREQKRAFTRWRKWETTDKSGNRWQHAEGW